MERSDRKEFVATDEQNPIFGFHWSAGAGQPAGMFWFDGRVVLAGLGTRAEAWLLDRGAIEVGTLRFDAYRADAERPVAAASVVPVEAAALLADAAVEGPRRN